MLALLARGVHLVKSSCSQQTIVKQTLNSGRCWLQQSNATFGAHQTLLSGNRAASVLLPSAAVKQVTGIVSRTVTEVGLQRRAFSYSRYPNWQTNRRSSNWDLDGGFVLWSLIGLNTAIFIGWHVFPYRQMSNHFVLSPYNLFEGRFYTLLTCGFSQQTIVHLGSNMITLYFFGDTIARVFGGKKLLGLYLIGATAGSVGHLLYYNYKNILNARGFGVKWWMNPGTPGCLGASGAVTAILILQCCLLPTARAYFYGVIPVPLALLGLIYLAEDITGAISGRGAVSHAGHLGGALTGIVAYIMFRRGRFRPRSFGY